MKKNNNPITRQNIYRDAVYRYGFLPVCLLLEGYADVENYEESQLILNALNTVRNETGTNLPTRFDVDALIFYKEQAKIKDLNTDAYLDKVKDYAKEIAQRTFTIPE